MLTSSLLLGCLSVLPHGPHHPPRRATRPAAPPLPHSIAYVTDPMSHGQVGDALLSLNEAIQLHNGTLSVNQLSILEQNQVAAGPGPGSDVAWIDIDETVTPTITVERDLDVIVDSQQGMNIRGYAGRPVIDFTTSIGTFGFRSLNNTTKIEELVILGADIGLEITQPPTLFTVSMLVRNVRFENQRLGGLQVSQLATGLAGNLNVDGCEFVGAPFGMRLDETGLGGNHRFLFGRCRSQNVDRALDVRLGSGGSTLHILTMLQLQANVEAIRYARPNGADRRLVLDATNAELRGGGLAIQGTTGPVLATLRFFDVAVPAGSQALAIGPAGSAFSGVIEDSRFDGSVGIAVGGAVGSVELWNTRVRNGTTVLASQGGQILRLDQVRFDNATITTGGAAAIRLQECCVASGSIGGSTGAPLLCDACWIQPAPGPFVTTTNPRPAAQLGSFQVLPAVVAIGGNLVLQADLPPGLFGVFALGFSTDNPLVLARPIHVYSDPANTATVPGIWRLQQSFVFAIPADPNLVSTDLTAHMVVLPDPGVAAPALSLPPGRRFVLQ